MFPPADLLLWRYNQAAINNAIGQSMANQYGGLQNMAGAAIGSALAQQQAGYLGSSRHPLEAKPERPRKKEITKAYLPEGESVYESLKRHVEEWAK